MDETEAIITALEVLRHYRTRAHVASDVEDWFYVASTVNRDAMAAADRVLAWAKQQRLMTPVDPYF